MQFTNLVPDESPPRQPCATTTYTTLAFAFSPFAVPWDGPKTCRMTHRILHSHLRKIYGTSSECDIGLGCVANIDYPVMCFFGWEKTSITSQIAKSQVSSIRTIMCHVIRCLTPPLESRHLIRTHCIRDLNACLDIHWCHLHQFDATNLRHLFNRITPSSASLAKVFCCSSIFLGLLLLHNQPCKGQKGRQILNSRSSSHLHTNTASISHLEYANPVPTIL